MTDNNKSWQGCGASATYILLERVHSESLEVSPKIHMAYILWPGSSNSLYVTKTTVPASFSCHLDLAQSHPKRSLSWGIAQILLACGYVSGELSSLLIDVEGPSPLWAASSPRQVIPGMIIKPAKHESGIEPANSIPSWFLLQVPSWVSTLTSIWTVNRKCKPNKRPPRAVLALVWVFLITETDRKLRQQPNAYT